SFRNSLIELVNSESIVGRGAPELVALWSGRNITVSSRIDQKTPSVDREPQTECVGMTVAGVARALRPGIDHELLPRSSAIDEKKSAGFKRLRQYRSLAFLPIEDWDGLVAEQPDRLFGQSRRVISVALIDSRAQGQRIAHALDAITPRIENPASIVIAESFDSLRLGQRLDYVQHFLQNSIEWLRNRKSVVARKDSRV